MNTQAQAFAAVKPTLPSLRNRVLSVIQSAGPDGVNTEQISNHLPGVPYGSISTRPNELIKAGLIRVQGTRKNSRGRSQNVYVAA